MGFLTWFKLGAIGAAAAAIIFLSWNYQHRGKVIEAQKLVIEQHEAAEKFYKAQPEIDKHTQELKNEVKKATDAGDIDRIKFLYDQLRRHKADSKGKAPRKTDDDGTDE